MMLDIEEKAYKPTEDELSHYVGNELFDELCAYMRSEYNPINLIEYSGDKILLGWNLKFKKSGKTLCTVYPRRGHFPLLLIVGRKEKEKVESLLRSMSEGFRKVYENTAEGMGQRWMLFDFDKHDDVFDDVLKVIKIRRESK